MRGFYFECCVHAIRNEEIKKQMSAHYQEWIDLLVSILQRYKKDMGLQHLREIAATVISILDGYHLQYSIDPSVPNLKIVEKVILDLVVGSSS
jgi:hypothetical protein